jgi:hypothetical protein
MFPALVGALVSSMTTTPLHHSRAGIPTRIIIRHQLLHAESSQLLLHLLGTLHLEARLDLLLPLRWGVRSPASPPGSRFPLSPCGASRCPECASRLLLRRSIRSREHPLLLCIASRSSERPQLLHRASRRKLPRRKRRSERADSSLF